MPSDQTFQVAVIGVISTLITTLGLVLTAVLNNKRERGGAADAGVEATLRERLVLRDEQIQDLKDEKEELQKKLTEALEENEEKTMLIRRLQAGGEEP